MKQVNKVTMSEILREFASGIMKGAMPKVFCKHLSKAGYDCVEGQLRRTDEERTSFYDGWLIYHGNCPVILIRDPRLRNVGGQ